MEEIKDHIYILASENQNRESAEVQAAAAAFKRILERYRRMPKLGTEAAWYPCSPL